MSEIPESFKNLNEVKVQFKKLLMADNFVAIFKLFNGILKPNTQMEKQVIIQQGRYRNIKEEIRNGIISHDPAQITINKIRVALQELVDDLELEHVLMEQGLHSGNKEKRSISLSDLEREGLESQAEMLQRKLNFFRQQEAITADPAQKFSLQMQIEEIENKLSEIRQKLGN